LTYAEEIAVGVLRWFHHARWNQRTMKRHNLALSWRQAFDGQEISAVPKPLTVAEA
jgi:hypothetical protein